jgi:excisionase family DNA binding protein
MSSAVRSRTHATDLEHEVLTVREAAQLLRVDQQTIYRKLWAGELPGDNSTGRWRLSREALLERTRLCQERRQATLNTKRSTTRRSTRLRRLVEPGGDE